MFRQRSPCRGGQAPREAARRRLRGKQPAGRTCAAAQVPGRRPQAAAAAEVPGRWLERSASGELVWVVCAPAQPRAGPGAPPPAARGAAPEAPPLPQDAPGDAASSSSTGAPGHQLAPLGFDALAEALDARNVYEGAGEGVGGVGAAARGGALGTSRLVAGPGARDRVGVPQAAPESVRAASRAPVEPA
ncbi:unnamed protein product [Prorocentrum cordatum]|uniref:Uncharacterized protein n=1 Tax=Prorocentrum cordatum TaxID=2364126 RepID=A0ABN9UDF0_9DINO|nr:unnamed protein product [Polarella glacialis]